MKAVVKFLSDDSRYGEYKKDDFGIIDSYITSGHSNQPFAVIFNCRTKHMMLEISGFEIVEYVDDVDKLNQYLKG